MALAVAEHVESVDLTPARLAKLIETVGGDVLGVSSMSELVRMRREGRIPDDAGATYLLSLLELAA